MWLYIFFQFLLLVPLVPFVSRCHDHWMFGPFISDQLVNTTNKLLAVKYCCIFDHLSSLHDGRSEQNTTDLIVVRSLPPTVAPNSRGPFPPGGGTSLGKSSTWTVEFRRTCWQHLCDKRNDLAFCHRYLLCSLLPSSGNSMAEKSAGRGVDIAQWF